jgi:hypothetical protein
VKFANENPTWGFDRIQGEVAKVGYHISDITIRNILKAHGIEPAPTRNRTGSWETFLKAHWDVMAAIALTTVEVWTKSGLVTFYFSPGREATRHVGTRSWNSDQTEAVFAPLRLSGRYSISEVFKKSSNAKHHTQDSKD